MKLTIWHKGIQQLLLSGDKEQMSVAIALLDDKLSPLYWYWLTHLDAKELQLCVFDANIDYIGFFLSKEAMRMGSPPQSGNYAVRLHQLRTLYEEYKIDNLDPLDPAFDIVPRYDELEAWDYSFDGQDHPYPLV